MSRLMSHAPMKSAGIGARIRRVRLAAKRTQRSVASGAGITAEYLSRLENNRVSPTMRTLQRIAETLDVAEHVFFEVQPHLEPSDRCPVSTSGRCILDHLHSGAGHGVPRHAGSDRYSTAQLEVLRACDFIARHGSVDVQDALAVIIRSLFADSGPQQAKRRLAQR